MASMVEALGMGLPGNAAIPAVDARRNVLARMAGRRIVEMVHEDLTMSKILTREAFENAIRTNAAIGGSTNAVIHLIAHRRPHRRRSSTSTTATGSASERALPGQPAALGQVPDGGLLLRRRPAGGDAEIGERACCTRTRSPSTARPSGENIERAPRTSTREVIKPLDATVQGQRRHRRAARQPLRRDGAVIKPIGGDAQR